VVTINLGTNDYAFGDPTEDAFSAAYSELVGMVRGRYPSALILCIAPLQFTCGGGHAKWQKMVGGIQKAVQGFQQRSDAKVRYHSTGTIAAPWLSCQSDYSDYTHPTVEGNRKFAERLLETLTTDIRTFFPEKCGGQGKRCEGTASFPAPVVSTTSTGIATTIATTTTSATFGTEAPATTDPASTTQVASASTTETTAAATTAVTAASPSALSIL